MVSPPIPAAQYIRMSTDTQDLSPQVQRRTIQQYAEAHGVEVVATYEDRGRSGLSLDRREAMKRLLHDVATDDCPFAAVLVYDVSRWGRFQDTDASAYYEYHCRMHGVDVIYVAEPFSNERTPMSALIKGLKRAMAAEYIRELRVKVKAGQRRTIDLGFQMGELPQLGFRRIAVGPHGTQVRPLAPHERKRNQAERIKWVPAAEGEVQLVRRLFNLYATTTVNITALARLLASESIRLPDGSPITRRMIRSMFRCEAYIGNFVWGKVDHKRRERRSNGEAGFTRAIGVLEPLVDRPTWEAVQERLDQIPSPRQRSKERLLSELRVALEINPALSCLELPAYGCATHRAYVSHFGSINEAVRQSGADLQAIREARRQAASRSHRLGRLFTQDARALLVSEGIPCLLMERPAQGLIVNQLRIRVQSMWRHRHGLKFQWFRSRTLPWDQDFLLLVRFQEDETARDLLLLDQPTYSGLPVWFSDDPPPPVVQIGTAADLVRIMRRISAGLQASVGLH